MEAFLFSCLTGANDAIGRRADSGQVQKTRLARLENLDRSAGSLRDCTGWNRDGSGIPVSCRENQSNPDPILRSRGRTVRSHLLLATTASFQEIVAFKAYVRSRAKVVLIAEISSGAPSISNGRLRSESRHRVTRSRSNDWTPDRSPWCPLEPENLLRHRFPGRSRGDGSLSDARQNSSTTQTAPRSILEIGGA